VIVAVLSNMIVGHLGVPITAELKTLEQYSLEPFVEQRPKARVRIPLADAMYLPSMTLSRILLRTAI